MLSLRQHAIDGVVEIWRGNEMLGQVDTTVEGHLRIVLGDCDPGGGIQFLWNGEPFAMVFQLPDGL